MQRDDKKALGYLEALQDMEMDLEKAFLMALDIAEYFSDGQNYNYPHLGWRRTQLEAEISYDYLRRVRDGFTELIAAMKEDRRSEGIAPGSINQN